MDISKILKTVDHTLLNQAATWDEIKVILDDAVKYETASVCIPASYVKDAADYLAGRIPVCTVIGFPNGYSTTAVKCFETEDAVKNGAEEIDMVINIGWVKDKKYDAVLEEIKAVKKACGGKLLKVIIETCLLTDEEKIELCKVVSESGAEYIKTSTGFGGGGATFDDVILFKENIAPHLKIKAAGGIADLSDAEKFLSLGADRLGTSRVVKAVKNINDNEKGGY
ncbi:MAG: deoxyribose-phosphate aldolase [Lachnospiraceae bacterium]|nr:deoxyribose-phosphate aldolase [Lachnospiraceae bacterium]